MGCLKDGNFQNLEASDVNISNLTLTGTFNSNLDVVLIDPTDTTAYPETRLAGASTNNPQGFLAANTLNVINKFNNLTNPFVLQLPSITGCAAGTVVQVLLAAGQGVQGNRTEIRSLEVEKLFGVITLRQNIKVTTADGTTISSGDGTVPNFQQDMTIVVGSGNEADATGRTGATRINLIGGLAASSQAVPNAAGHRGGQLQFVNRNNKYWWVTGSLMLGNDATNTLSSLDETDGTNAYGAGTQHVCTA